MDFPNQLYLELLNYVRNNDNGILRNYSMSGYEKYVVKTSSIENATYLLMVLIFFYENNKYDFSRRICNILLNSADNSINFENLKNFGRRAFIDYVYIDDREGLTANQILV